METMLPQLQKMREYFTSRVTYTYEYRKQQLIKLKKTLYKYEKEIYAALYADLKKNPEECWITETGFTISEINYALKNLASWMRLKSVGTNLLNFPSRSYIPPRRCLCSENWKGYWIYFPSCLPLVCWSFSRSDHGHCRSPACGTYSAISSAGKATSSR